MYNVLQVVCFSGFIENFVDAEGKFSSHLTKLFLARATVRADLRTLAISLHFSQGCPLQEQKSH